MQLCESTRPQRLEEIIGNEKAVALLRRFLAKPFPSAWLLEGPSGIGKTSAARAIALALAGGHQMDWQTYNGRDVDQRLAEQIRDTVQMCPWNGGWRVIVIDEADQMTQSAQIAFLSILEALGARSIVVMTSNEREDFEPRFLSRLKVVHFSTHGLLAPAAKHLIEVARAHGLELEESRAKQMMRDARNNIRTALQSLEMDLMLVEGFGG